MIVELKGENRITKQSTSVPRCSRQGLPTRLCVRWVRLGVMWALYHLNASSISTQISSTDFVDTRTTLLSSSCWNIVIPNRTIVEGASLLRSECKIGRQLDIVKYLFDNSLPDCPKRFPEADKNICQDDVVFRRKIP